MDFVDKKEGDLDALISAHRTYVDNVTRKVLVQRDRPGKEVCKLMLCCRQASQTNLIVVSKGTVFRILQELYTIILHFRTAMVRSVLSWMIACSYFRLQIYRTTSTRIL